MFKKLLKINFFVLLASLLSFFFLPLLKGVGVLLGVSISAFSITVSSWFLEVFWDKGWNVFNKVFFLSTFLRFIFSLTALGILLGTTKIDEIYFTVSFIISYLCYSITEMIFFYKILQKKSTKE